MNAESDALYLVFLRNGRFSVQTCFIMHKSLGGHAETSVTSPLLQLSNFMQYVNIEESDEKCKKFR